MDWSQLRTILWLRGRLLRNQWCRGGKLNLVLTMIAVAIGYGIAVAGAFGGVLAGALALSKVSPVVMLLVWDIVIVTFLFFWMIGVITELQRSETIDISRLLHLPVCLKDIFLVNFVASHLAFSIILFLPAMLGLCLGLVLGGRWSMALMFPLVLGLIFMVTSWTYCLRGWLAALMLNKRRRRAIIAGITFTFILLSQLPNLLGNFLHDRQRHRPRLAPPQQTALQPADSDKELVPPAIVAAHKYVPFLWVGNGAMSLAQGSVWPAVLGAAGAFGIGGLGLRRAYRSTMRFYMGQGAAKKSTPKAKAAKAAAAGTGLLERRLPGVPDEAAAAAVAFFRSMMRAPEVKMALATNFLVLLILGAMVLARRSSHAADEVKPFIATGAIVFVLLGISQLMFNHFGFDRSGFRQLVLLPAPRKWILLGKNLAFAPIAMTMGLTALALATLALRVSPFVFLAAALQLAAAFLLVGMVGNLLSVLVPHHITPGSLKRTKTSATTTLLIIISRMLFPLAMTPLFIPAAAGLLVHRVTSLPAAPVNLLFSAVLAVLLALLYKLSLNPLGELLQRRERQILQVVTEEIE